MTNATYLLRPPARVLIVGYPGSGKTGALACLVNAGWKMRILDFDGNYEALIQRLAPEAAERLDIVSLEDKMRAGARFFETDGPPTAFAQSCKLMDHWKYKDPVSGEEVDLGRPEKDWGPDTIMVLDSMTAQGVSIMRRAMALANKTPETRTDRVFNFAMEEQDAFFDRLTSVRNRFHVMVLAHIKMIGPKEVRKGDDQITEEVKRQQAEIVVTRLYPRALGRELPQQIGGHFPTLINAETQILGGDKVRRVLRTVPRPELDIKVPALEVADNLPLKDGLLTIMKALGHEPPKNGQTAEVATTTISKED